MSCEKDSFYVNRIYVFGVEIRILSSKHVADVEKMDTQCHQKKVSKTTPVSKLDKAEKEKLHDLLSSWVHDSSRKRHTDKTAFYQLVIHLNIFVVLGYFSHFLQQFQHLTLSLMASSFWLYSVVTAGGDKVPEKISDLWFGSSMSSSYQLSVFCGTKITAEICCLDADTCTMF